MEGPTKKRKLENIKKEVFRLFQALKVKQWDTVIDILKQHNGKLILQSAENMNLEQTCQRYRFPFSNCPIRVVQLAHELSPDFTLRRDRNGYSALHNFCLASNCDEIIVDFFLEHEICSVMMKATDGSLPLHCAIRSKKKAETIYKLLNANNSSVHETDNKDRNPLHVFVETWKYCMESTRAQYNGNFENIPESHEDHQILQQVKEILLHLLNAIKNKILIKEEDAVAENWLPLHEAIKMREIPEIFLLVLSATMPEQFYGKDEDENLPHHLLMWRSDLDTYSVIHMCQKFNLGVEVANGDGMFPLTLAIERQRSWDLIESISLLGPQVLSTRDSETSMYPFMQAATKIEDERASINTVYGLLRWNPFLIRMAIPMQRG